MATTTSIAPSKPLGHHQEAPYSRHKRPFSWEYLTRVATVDTLWKGKADSMLGKSLLARSRRLLMFPRCVSLCCIVQKNDSHLKTVLGHNPRTNPQGSTPIFSDVLQ